MAKKREIRNSTAEFLTFIAAGKGKRIQVLLIFRTTFKREHAHPR